MADPRAQFTAFALAQLKAARDAATADSEKQAASARTTLDLAQSDELRAAVAQDPTAQKRIAAAVAAAKQTLADISNANTTREQTFQRLEEDLKRFSEHQ